MNDTGHLMYLEHPAEFVRIVTEFIGAHGPVRFSVCEARTRGYCSAVKRSPNRTARWGRAAFHAEEAVFHLAMIFRRAR